VLDIARSRSSAASASSSSSTRGSADIPLNDLDAKFDAVFLSIGTWKEGWVYLPAPN
jgi:hypothetical protein